MSECLACPWCLSTPPRHDRCEQVVYVPREKVGETLDSVGATVPVFDGSQWVECQCECRRQESLW